MQAGIKKWIFYVCVIIMTVACINIGFDYVTSALEKTNRNELYSPDEYNVSVTSPEGYAKIYENNNFEYYYSSKKTILKILNKKSGFVWSTGADTDRKDDVVRRCSGITKDSNEYYACSLDIGPIRNGNDTETSYAQINGLLYFTLLNGAVTNDIWTTTTNTTSILYGHKDYANEWMFKMQYRVEKIGSPQSSAGTSNSDAEEIVLTALLGLIVTRTEASSNSAISL